MAYDCLSAMSRGENSSRVEIYRSSICETTRRPSLFSGSSCRKWTRQTMRCEVCWTACVSNADAAAGSGNHPLARTCSCGGGQAIAAMRWLGEACLAGKRGGGGKVRDYKLRASQARHSLGRRDVDHLVEVLLVLGWRRPMSPACEFLFVDRSA